MTPTALPRRRVLAASVGLAAALGPLRALAADGDPAARLAEQGVVLPKLSPAIGSYAPFVRDGRLLYISGQLPMREGKLTATGLVPSVVSLETAQAAARQCAINIIAAASAACDGDLSKIAACLKLTGFVAADPGFTDHPKVINGASDLIKAVFGAPGQHARAAVGVASLPLGAPVEIDAIFALKA